MNIISVFYKWRFRIKYNSASHRRLRSLVINFYDYHSEPEFHYLHFKITKCRFYDYPSHMLIEIHSLSPGMIIGARGKCMDAFTNFMRSQLCKPVKIQLEETNPFK
jgi:hypothetical protein